MAPPSFRADTLAVQLIEQLEAHRRTWQGEPARTEADLSRRAEEQIRRFQADHVQIMGGGSYGDRLGSALQETFLPRYLRLALEQNALEEAGWKAWRGGDPVARVLAALGMLVLALVLTRVVRSPVVLVAYLGVFLVPLGPELRSIWYRWQYRRALQQVVDDLSRLQGELDQHAMSDLDDELGSTGSRPTRAPGLPDPDDGPKRPPPTGERTS